MNPNGLASLSPKQRQCLRLVFDHLTSKEIAPLVSLTPGVVDQYVKRAVRALGAKDRFDAARMLQRLELQSLDVDPLRTFVPTSFPLDRGDQAPSIGRRLNDLNWWQRLLVIALVAIGGAIAFAGVSSGLQWLSTIAR